MSVERATEVMTRLWDSGHSDTGVMAEDVVFTLMATGQEYRGREGVSRMFEYFYRDAFDLRFNHEEFCDGLYVHRKTLSLTIFVGSQAAFLTAG